MIYTNYQYSNGYGLDDKTYDEFIDLCYGFEEYYYYHKQEYVDSYRKIVKLLNDARNNKLEENYYHALLGWYIIFKNHK